jgi:hypothetical protein
MSESEGESEGEKPAFVNQMFLAALSLSFSLSLP